ncbi:MAG: endopeptidase La [Tannerella sp.]|jgi:ATP-dependent Lon protease|nr:endopeptidase La [Tannerella sp.]
MNNKKSIRIYKSDSFDDIDDTIVAVPILMECDKDEDFSEGVEKVGDTLPILPLRNMVLFPGVAMPVIAGRSKSMRLIRNAVLKKMMIGVCCQTDSTVDEPGFDDLYHVGVIAEIMRVLEMPDGTTTVIIQGKKRFSLKSLTETEPFLVGKIEQLEETRSKKTDREFEALASTIKDLTIKMLSSTMDPPRDLIFSIRNNQNILYLINFSSCNVITDAAIKQELLSINDLKDRAYRLLFILNREYQLLELKASIQMKTHEDINKQQKEYFLQQQIKAIQKELGGDNINDIEVAELRGKAKKKKWTKEVGEVFEKEITKLERLNPQSPDYSMQVQYVQTIVNLPWGEYSKDNFNLKRAERILNRDHYGMDKIKERIIEHLAVLKLKKDLRSPIICLYGPPGVGKTSLGKSIAEALNRKYVRISLGGLHDEAEIRGHRRTYIGAMAGRIIENIKKTGTSNPVFVLDEIDKVGNDFKGDPASALLEALDPEQNERFHDNYLDIDYDLSKVMFIATANNLNTISQPLLDRMELIEVSGYISEEKMQIALRHLIPKQMDFHGIQKEKIGFDKQAVRLIIDSYTRESGVRELEKKIAKVMRKIARRIASDEKAPSVITTEYIREYLGAEEYTPDKYQGNQYAGVVTGLAWTSAGGEILFVETSLSKSKSPKLTITGNLGDVMKESAVIALEYVRSHADAFGIDESMFESRNVHIHVPEGAIPKDGPSAGITMATSLVSAFTKRKVCKNLAMTGEITLRGKALPVGGIKEKILAAKRAGIKYIILSEENKKDINEIKAEYLKGLTFRYVSDIADVISYALLKETAKE